MNASKPLVGVVVPMYNAAATIDATPASVCAQRHRSLDIVVVDDGCSDSSAAIVEAWSARDSRVRLIRQSNAGVAAARNAGAAATAADFLAFVDADDVWAPEKIALQMDMLMRAQGMPALVYCWFTQIDYDGRAYAPGEHPAHEGNVLRQLCRSNFVGNGSSMLMPKSVFEHIGGFDPSLRARNAQGCEDLMFLMHAAETYPFRVVPRHLVGYRLTPDNMSSDTPQMLRSFDLVAALYREKRPAFAAELHAHRTDMMVWLVRRSLIAGKLGTAGRFIMHLFAADPGLTARMLPDLWRTFLKAKLVPDWVKKMSRASLRRPRYEEVSW